MYGLKPVPFTGSGISAACLAPAQSQQNQRALAPEGPFFGICSRNSRLFPQPALRLDDRVVAVAEQFLAHGISLIVIGKWPNLHMEQAV